MIDDDLNKNIDNKPDGLRWQFRKMKDIVYIKGRIGWKGLKKSEFGTEGTLIINGPDLESGRVKWSECLRVPDWRFVESKEISIRENDILLTKDGTIGKVAFVEKPPEPATLASGIFLLRSRSEKILLPKFLYAYLSSRFFANFVLERVEGSVIPHLYQRDIEEIAVPLPPINEQQSIAKILSDLDSKIELNQKMNKTLESIAQAIFKHWFIDFEFPNEEGKPYRSSGGEMVDSELGEIPKGWEVKRLSDELNQIISGSRPKGGIDKELTIGIPNIGAENINGLGYYDYSKTKYVTQEFFDRNVKGRVRDLDVLLYKDGAQIGRKTIFGKGFPFDNCMINEHVFILRVKQDLTQGYLYFWLDQSIVTESIKNLNTNSAQPGLNKEAIGSIEIIIPNHEILLNFESQIAYMLNRIFFNALQSNKLKQIINLLLPVLISGRVRVQLEDEND